MALITLLTDYGYKDPYVAGLKAKILSFNQAIHIVDISHGVQKFHIQEASYLLNSVYKDFPKGTVHLVGVELAFTPCDFLIVSADGYLFVIPDNGILSMIVGFKAEQVVEIDSDTKTTDVFKDKLVEIACGLSEGRSPLEYGKEIGGMELAFCSELKVTADELTGSVVYVDSYGNLITDIPKEIIETTSYGRVFEVSVGREYVKKISEDYKEGEATVIAVYNSNGYLEIAMTEASASKLFGLRCGDLVTVKFKPKQSLL
jgi:S-adenosylmethionine hydrolase